MKSELKTCLKYTAVFYIFIVYWELLLYLAAHGSLSGIKGVFLLFALPQAMVPAAFCGSSMPSISSSGTSATQ